MRAEDAKKWPCPPLVTTVLQCDIETGANHPPSSTPNSKGSFLFSQATLPLLLAATPTSPHPPSLIFTGATASVKGSALFAAFATMKFALRALAQSLAREFGPKGVHVAHAVIDGVIDVPRTQGYGLPKEAMIDPAAIAETYWHLHTQPKTTFTWEIDIRPGVEKW